MKLAILRQNKILITLSAICFSLLITPFITYKIYYILNKNELVICFALSLTLILLFSSLILITIYNNQNNQKKIFSSYNKSLSNLKYEELVIHAKLYNKSPISKDSYQILLNAKKILENHANSVITRKKYSEKELKLLSKAGRILFEHLEVELLISEDDHIKLEKINEILILETINKIKNSEESENISSFNENNSDNDLNKQDNITDISDRKKLH